MWHLDDISAKEMKRYISWLESSIVKNVNKLRGNAEYKDWCDYLVPILADGSSDTRLVEDILSSKPSRLFKLNHRHLNNMLKLMPVNLYGYHDIYSEKLLRRYLKAKAKKRRTPKQQSLIDRYEKLLTFLYDVFDYGLIKEEVAYNLSLLKGRNTCTYCNRQYTFTVGKVTEKGKIVSKVRPQFDHWFAHRQYPLLGLSFYNLIPSCSVCNSSVKGSAHYSLKTHIHPYTNPDSDPDFKFVPTLEYMDTLHASEWSVLLGRKRNGKEDKTITDLSLDEIYEKHGPLEVKDIMDFEIKNNSTYLKTLFDKVCVDLGMKYTREDVFRMMFGVEVDIEKTLDRPLSKLKRDVLEWLGIVV